MINSRDLADLHPKVATLTRQFIEKCAKDGIKVLITSTKRDNESQNALYAIGRTTPGKIVTKAKGGQSYHNYGLAADFVPIVAGKAMWNDKALFNRCGAIAESVGLEWAGRWTRFPELAHVQYSNSLSIQDLQAGRTID